MKEGINFLKDLQKQLQYQEQYDNDCQASPRFWVVGDYKWESCWEGNAERYDLCLPSFEHESYEINQFIKEIDKSGMKNKYDLEQDALDAIQEIECEESALEWVKEYIDEDAYLVPVRKVHFIRQNTMFLTKEEAKRHIETNHYHYSSAAHTYAMTAWRSPTVEKLLCILTNFDWDSIE